MKKISQLKIGVILSYLLVFLNGIYGLLLTPYIIASLGIDEYGVYKTITALTSSLLILELGVGETSVRYVASYCAKNQQDKIPAFMGMMAAQAGGLCFLTLLVGICGYFLLVPIYGKSFSLTQLSTAKICYVLLAANVILQIFSNLLNGLIKGYNRFLFANGITLICLLSRMLLVWALLCIYHKAVVLVLISLFLTIAVLIAQWIHIRKNLHVKIDIFSRWEKELFLESGKYTGLMFLTSVISQVECNLDNVVIGAITGPEAVAIYSIGLLIFGIYINLSTAVSGVLLPTITNILENQHLQELKQFIIKAGRIQFSLLAAAIVGFACVGKDFLHVWLGADFDQAYIITLILMIPALFELCVNACLSVLRAKNKLGFRTWVLFATTALNFVLTIILVKTWSFIGAAVGTAISYIVASIIVMNIYYVKQFDLPMWHIYLGIFKRIWICLLAAGSVLFLSSRFIHGNWLAIGVNILLFCIVYGVSLWGYGLSPEERNMFPIFRRGRTV